MAAAGADRASLLAGSVGSPRRYRHGTSPFSDRFKSEVRRSAMVLVKTPPQPDYGTEITDGDKVAKPAANARQGVSEQNVRYVLAAGLLGVVVVFVLVYAFFFAA
jgi:hypothetical protein